MLRMRFARLFSNPDSRSRASFFAISRRTYLSENWKASLRAVQWVSNLVPGSQIAEFPFPLIVHPFTYIQFSFHHSWLGGIGCARASAAASTFFCVALKHWNLCSSPSCIIVELYIISRTELNRSS